MLAAIKFYDKNLYGENTVQTSNSSDAIHMVIKNVKHNTFEVFDERQKKYISGLCAKTENMLEQMYS